MKSLHHPSLALTCTIFALAALLTACSGPESKIYDAYKCGKVADMLGRRDDANAAAFKIKPLIDELERQQVNQSQYLMGMMDKFTDDLALYKLSPMGQAQKVNEVYQSSTCQKLYKP